MGKAAAVISHNLAEMWLQIWLQMWLQMLLQMGLQISSRGAPLRDLLLLLHQVGEGTAVQQVEHETHIVRRLVPAILGRWLSAGTYPRSARRHKYESPRS